MPSLPTSSDLHVNALLTQLSIGFEQDDIAFVADEVCPTVEVDKQSDKYAEYDRSYFYRTEVAERSPGTQARAAGYGVSTSSTYYCDVFALRKAIDDQERGNADAIFDLDQDAMRYLLLQHKIKKEAQFVTDLFTTSLWTGSTTAGDITPSTLWSASGSTPFNDIRAQAVSIQTKTGYKPNTLVMGGEVWAILADHPDLLDRIKGGATTGDPALAMENLVAQVLGLSKVLVAGATQNTAVEGATASYSRLLGKHALLCYVAPNPGKFVPSAAYQFAWRGLVGSAGGQRVLTYREEPHIDWVEVEASYDLKLISAPLGAFFASVVA